MGQRFATKAEKRRWDEDLAQREEAKMKARLDLADKIIMVIVDKIVSELIRPGPATEERECYEMAQELRDMVPALKISIVEVLKVENPQWP